MDIDIDTQSKFDPIKIFNNCIKATVVKDDKINPHPCGVYFQNMPKNPISGLAAIPYDVAKDLDYLKIDFLHLSVYDNFQSREEIEELLKIEPDWNLLLIPSIVEKLFQMSKNAEILLKLKPKSIEDLADAIALIRPGKKEILNLYLANKQAARRMLYAKDDSGYSFKKSHALAYSMVIVLQMHCIDAGII